MAVEDKHVNSLVAAGKKAPAQNAGGAQLLCLTWAFEVAAADDDGSVYRLGRIPANAIPVKSEIFADTLTGLTDIDLGVYKPGVGGAVVDKDLFADGLDPAGGEAITAPLNGLTNLGGADPVGNYGKNVWELLGLTAPSRQDYDLALTANTAGSGAGTISGNFWYLIG
jgi:hypothetical protein